MSYWVKAKLGLKCSINILMKALIKVMPEWEGYIQSDKDGKLSIYTYRGVARKGKFHIVIPGSNNRHFKQAPNVVFNDIGFRQEKDGSWTVEVDRDGLVKDVEGEVIKEVAAMKMIAIARQRGDQVLTDKKDGEERVIITRMFEEKAPRFIYGDESELLPSS